MAVRSTTGHSGRAISPVVVSRGPRTRKPLRVTSQFISRGVTAPKTIRGPESHRSSVRVLPVPIAVDHTFYITESLICFLSACDTSQKVTVPRVQHCTSIHAISMLGGNYDIDEPRKYVPTRLCLRVHSGFEMWRERHHGLCNVKWNEVCFVRYLLLVFVPRAVISTVRGNSIRGLDDRSTETMHNRLAERHVSLYICTASASGSDG